MLLTLLLTQAIADLPPLDFDLAKATPRPASCSAADGDGIVVCARRRTAEIPRGPELPDTLPKAEIGLFGNVRGSLGVRQGSVGGIPSNKVMATIAIPF